MLIAVILFTTILLLFFLNRWFQIKALYWKACMFYFLLVYQWFAYQCSFLQNKKSYPGSYNLRDSVFLQLWIFFMSTKQHFPISRTSGKLGLVLPWAPFIQTPSKDPYAENISCHHTQEGSILLEHKDAEAHKESQETQFPWRQLPVFNSSCHSNLRCQYHCFKRCHSLHPLQLGALAD